MIRRDNAAADLLREWHALHKPDVIAYPLADWRPEHGDVVWWRFPVTNPPYIGQPEDTDWPAVHTHWTPIPKEPSSTREVGRGK